MTALQALKRWETLSDIIECPEGMFALNPYMPIRMGDFWIYKDGDRYAAGENTWGKSVVQIMTKSKYDNPDEYTGIVFRREQDSRKMIKPNAFHSEALPLP